MQLDLSRLSLSRQIAREQHWVVRVLLGILSLIYVGYFGFFLLNFTYNFGALLHSSPDPALQIRLLTAGVSIFWVICFALSSRYYHWLLFEGLDLREYLTMPLTTLQIFWRTLPRIVKPTAWLLIPLAAMWIAFVGGFTGWDLWRLPSLLPVLAAQWLLNLVVPLLITLLAYRVYESCATAICSLAASGIATISILATLYEDAQYGLALCDAVVRHPVVQGLIYVCPGAWIARLFISLISGDGGRALWAGTILLVSALAWILVSNKVRLGYTEEAILAEQERRWTRMENKERGFGQTVTTRHDAPRWRVLDRVYETSFSQQERGWVSLIFRDAYEGDMTWRAVKVAVFGALCCFLTVGVSWLVLLFVPPKGAGEIMPFVLFLLVPIALPVMGSTWCASYGDNFRKHRQQRRGSMEVPLLEIVPLEPKKFIWTCFRFLSLIAACSWACVLPAFFGAQLNIPLLYQLLILLGILGGLLEVSFIVPIIALASCRRHYHRTLWAEVKMLATALATVVISGCGFMLLAGALVGLLQSLGLSANTAVGGVVPLAVCLADIAIYHGFLRMYRGRNFDAEPVDQSAVFPAWMQGRWGR